MEKDKKEFGSGEAFGIFSILVVIHLSLAPKDFRQELVDYSFKFYGIAIIIGLIYAFVKERIKAKRIKEAKDAEEERLRMIRERMERIKEEERKE